MHELPPIDVRQRVDRLLAVLRSSDFGFLYLHDLMHVRWLTGFTGSAGAALVDSVSGEVHLLTDSRYKDQARLELASAKSDATVHLAKSTAERCAEIARIAGRREVNVDATELTLDFHRTLCENSEVRVMTGRSPVVELRRVKDAAEIARMERASHIADLSLQEVVAEGICGLSERQVRVSLEHRMALHGADAPSFDTIVATGANAALPHHHPDDTVIQPNHMVVVDMGALVDGYHSDMTRTVCVGEPTDHDATLMALVVESQARGLAAVRAGVAASDIDSTCREVFVSAGVDSLYTHGTGHGVGLVIHEEPFFHRDSRQTLAENEVVTVEPGLYRVGVSGVRIEDLVVVTGSGCQILTQTPKDLTCPPSRRTT